MAIVRLDTYIAVSDLDAALEFWEKVFERGPALRTENYVGFQIGGAMFGLFRGGAYGYPLSRGNSAVPNILVTNIEAEFSRVRALNPPQMTEIRAVGPTRIFQFTDYDGNVVEFYALD